MSNKDYICRFTHNEESSKMKCVLRTLFYQFLLLFVGASIGFICNAEWVGWKYPVVTRSISNTFFPIDFEDPGVLQMLYGHGRLKIFGVMNNGYRNVEVIEEAMLAEEWYWVKFSYTDNDGKTITDIQHVRIRWKPWEYYFNNDIDAMDEEAMRKYIEEGTLNSRESDRAFRLMHESNVMKGKVAKT